MGWNKLKSNGLLSTRCIPKLAWQETAMISFTVLGQLDACVKTREAWTKSRKPFAKGKILGKN